MAWKGTAAGGALSFPASGQTWPALTKLFLGASSTTTAKDITGPVDANGKVDLTLASDTVIQVGANQCTLTGTVQLSSQGTEKIGGQAVGKNYAPATGQFAVVSTSYAAPATGSCLLLNAAYDLSKGMGWSLTGTMTLPGVTPAPVVQKQTAAVKTPERVKRTSCQRFCEAWGSVYRYAQMHVDMHQRRHALMWPDEKPPHIECLDSPMTQSHFHLPEADLLRL